MSKGEAITTFFEFCVWVGNLVGTLLGETMAIGALTTPVSRDDVSVGVTRCSRESSPRKIGLVQAAVGNDGVPTLMSTRSTGDVVAVEGTSEGEAINTFFEFCVWAGDLVGTLLGGFMAPPMIKRLMTTSGTNLRRQKTTPPRKFKIYCV